jgi:hypothetical protein
MITALSILGIFALVVFILLAARLVLVAGLLMKRLKEDPYAPYARGQCDVIPEEWLRKNGMRN